MALQNALKRSGISIGKIQKSVTSFNSGLTQANKTTSKLDQSLSKRHKIKKKALHMDKVLFHRRRQAVRRKEGEDLIEASTIKGSGKRSGKILSASTRGFMGRIFDFVGLIAVGWLVNTLPKWIDLARALMRRVNQAGVILGGFINRVNVFLKGIWSILNGAWDFVRFKDFTTVKSKVGTGFDKLKMAFGQMDDEISKANRMSEDWSPDGSGGGGESDQQQSSGIANWMQVKPDVEEPEGEVPPPVDKPEGIMGAVAGFGDFITGNAFDFDKQNKPEEVTKEEDRPKGFMRGVLGFADAITGDTWNLDQQPQSTDQQSVEPQNQILPNVTDSNQVGDTVTGEDLTAVNQERELGGQEPLKSETQQPPIPPKQKEERPWWNKALGVVDAITGGATDFDGKGSEGQLFEGKPSPDAAEGLVEDGEGRTIVLPPQEVRVPLPPQQLSSNNKSIRFGGRVNSSQELVRQITLNNLQYT